MHRALRNLLPAAKGESHLVVVVFLDVRGFSSFARMAESSEAAIFLRSVYVRILDEYFQDAAFFKPTGDGLLIVLDYDDHTIQDVVNLAVSSSLRLVHDFPSLTQDDEMVNFDVPAELGIGVARGAATALVSGRKTLDYSGRPLNLAARLMDLARPFGVVLSGRLGFPLLEDELRSEFTEEGVYIKGISENEKLPIYISKKSVVIPPANKRPINKYEWKPIKEETISFKQLLERGYFLHQLPEQPALDEIRIFVRHDKATAGGRRHASLSSTHTFGGEYVERQGRHLARVNYTPIARRLNREGVKPTWRVKISGEYAVQADE